MNEIDYKLLELLKKDGKRSLKDLEEKLKIRSSTIHSRIKKLELKGIIKNYTLNLDNKQLGYPLVAFIMLKFDQNRTEDSQEDIAKKIATLPRCEEVHLISGEYDILVKVRDQSIEEFGNFVTRDLKEIQGIANSRSFFSLNVVKESTDQPHLISKIVNDNKL